MYIIISCRMNNQIIYTAMRRMIINYSFFTKMTLSEIAGEGKNIWSTSKDRYFEVFPFACNGNLYNIQIREA